MEHSVNICYHGRLSRQTAEERLNLSSRPGSYLLRESDRKSGTSYVLSYLGLAGINHFRVTHVYGSYFIGGRQFDSLSELIHYYTKTCDLLTNERLLHPIPPPEPIAAKDRIFISMFPYNKLAQSDELSFKKGEVFIMQNELSDGWLWCREIRNGQSGLVFLNLVEEITDKVDDPNEVFPWFHAKITKVEAVNKLAEAGPGSYLVRPSDNSPGNYTLFYNVGSTVQRFLIVRNDENKFTMGGKFFDSLGQIIDMYKTEQIIEGHTLQFPIYSSGSKIFSNNNNNSQQQVSNISSTMEALDLRNQNKRSQEIYNTVKLSREAARLRQSNEIRGWLSLKKKKTDNMSDKKKWKSYYFVLNSRDKHLYYYEKPQQIKPRGLIDLSYSYLYIIHESLFEWPQCFQLVERCLPCFANHFYLRCDEDHRQYRTWINSIRKFTSPSQLNRKSVTELIDKINNNPTSGNNNSIGRHGTSSAGDENYFDERRCLYLSFIEAHSIKVSQPYFVVALNQDVKIAKTPVKSSPTANFTNEDGYFNLENIPSDVTCITILMLQGNKRKIPKSSKSLLDYPQFSIDLTRLAAAAAGQATMDKYFEFKTAIQQAPFGVLRVRLGCTSDIILNLNEYAGLHDLLCNSATSAETILLLDDVISRRKHSTAPANSSRTSSASSDQLKLARALSHVFRHRPASSTRVLRHLVESVVDIEFQSAESDPTSVFRKRSLPTMLLEFYMRSNCHDVLTRCLQSSVLKLLDDKISCELNPAKMDGSTSQTSSLVSSNVISSERACENLQNLLNIMEQLVSNIYESTNLYPIHVRYLMLCLQRNVLLRWPNEQLVRTRVISGFLFLRLICPTLLNPKQFNLIQETPSENAIRNLTLLAKCLQNLANLVETSKTNNSLAQLVLTTLDDYAIYPMNNMQPSQCHNHQDQSEYSIYSNSVLEFILSPQIETWMEVVNPFILKNKIGMVKFIDELCNVHDYDESISDSEFIELDLSGGHTNLSYDNRVESENQNGESMTSAKKYYASLLYDEEVQDPARNLAIVHKVAEKYLDDIEQLAESSPNARKLATIVGILTQHMQYYENLRKGVVQKHQPK